MKKKPLKLKDINVWEQIYDPHADGYLTAGKLKDTTSEKPFIMSWHRRGEKKLIKPRTYKSKGWLTRAYNAALNNDDWPDKKTFKNDTHKHRLYRWEETYLQPHTVRISEKTARQVIRQVCEDYGMAPIKLRWYSDADFEDLKKKDKYKSLYHWDLRRIDFVHRDLVALLHEIGHALHDETLERKKGSHHPPAFARQVIELYHRYAGFPIDYLVVTAHQENLLGDLNTEQLIFDPIAHRPRINIPRLGPPRNP